MAVLTEPVVIQHKVKVLIPHLVREAGLLSLWPVEGQRKLIKPLHLVNSREQELHHFLERRVGLIKATEDSDPLGSLS